MLLVLEVEIDGENFVLINFYFVNTEPEYLLRLCVYIVETFSTDCAGDLIFFSILN